MYITFVPFFFDGDLLPSLKDEIRCILVKDGSSMVIFRRHDNLQKKLNHRVVFSKTLLPISLFLIQLFMGASTAEALERRDVSGELQWTSTPLQGAAGIGALSESWVDQAHKEPSMLARRKQDFEIEFFGLSSLLSKDAANTLTDTVKAFIDSNRSESSSSAASTTANALDKVRDVFGKSMTAQSSLSLLGMRFSRFSVSPYLVSAIDVTIDNAVWPKLDALAGGYAGLLVGYAQPIKKDFDLGVVIRPGVGGFKRYELDLSLFGEALAGPQQALSSLDDLLAFPVAFYVPLDLAVGWWMGPSSRIHASVQNAFGAAPINDLSGTPQKIPSRLNLGFSQQIPIRGSQQQQLHFAGELQDALGMMGGWNELLMRAQVAARYTARLPFRDQTTFGLNLGLHSGYPVASVLVDMFLAKFEFGLSARENGGYPGQRPNQLLSFTIRGQLQF